MHASFNIQNFYAHDSAVCVSFISQTYVSLMRVIWSDILEFNLTQTGS